jgi:pimeloyl-ACP methyl ester carboxylesterase
MSPSIRNCSRKSFGGKQNQTPGREETMSTEPMASLGPPAFIEADGMRIRYLRGPGPADTTIVLLSPFPESLYAYDRIWADLSAVAPLVALDLPGFGQSQSRPELMTPQAMGRFLTKILPMLGLRRVHAIGPDVGTSALLYAAAENPDLFVSLIVGSGGTDVERTGAGLKAVIEAPSTDAFATVDGADYVSGVMEQRVLNKPSGYVLDDYRASYGGRRAVEAMDYLRSYTTSLPLLQASLPDIQTPVLGIWGAHDPIVLPNSAEVLDRALPHTRSIVIDSGHFVWHDRPQEYAAAVTEWINGGYASV